MWKKSSPKTSETPDGLTVIERTTRLQGNLFASAPVRIDGVVDGDVYVEAELTVGSEGQITGTIKAKEAYIAGKVRGDLFVDGALSVAESADIQGTIEYRALSVEMGAALEGTLRKKAPEDAASAHGDGGRRGKFQSRIRPGKDPDVSAPAPAEASGSHTEV
ncbi:MAG: polymer-forming cytoskeletal protein [Hydrogenibacillus sp.]|nr:polymer-forming cytoskeletal protein [Hydrogenibacillus sp.]